MIGNGSNGNGGGGDTRHQAVGHMGTPEQILTAES